MTRDEIIYMAKASGWLSEYDTTTGFVAEAAFKFAAMVASAERRRHVWTQSHWTEYEQNIVAAERERLAKLFDDRDKSIGFYEPHEPAEIIRGQA
jgi:hypothetical protein